MTVRFITSKLPPLVASLKITTAMMITTRFLYKTNITRRDGRGNFFTYLGLLKSPELDRLEVQRAYHNLQRRVHPDQANVQAKEAQEKQREEEEQRHEMSTLSTSPLSPSSSSSLQAEGEITVANVDESTYANASYETLRDPYLRCKYLMRLTRAEEVKGGPLMPAEEEALMHDDDHRSMVENKKLMDIASENISPPVEFLAEIMEVNELIFSADASNDSDRAQLQNVLTRMEERYDECYENVKACWKRRDLPQFYRCVVEWTYICNVLKHAKERLE